MKISSGITVDRLEDLLVHSYEMSRSGLYCPVMIWGEAGVGKSQTVARVASRLGIGMKDLRLGLFEAPDLLGVFRQQEVFPCFVDFEEDSPRAVRGRLYTRHALYAHLADSHPHRIQGGTPTEVVDWAISEARKRKLGSLFSVRTVNSPPSWLPQPGTSGILFLDELNRATREVRQGTFQIVLDRMVGQIPLPKGWIIVSANNPPDIEGKGMGYQVSSTDDRAFLSRFCHVAVQPSPSEWLSWARRSGISPQIRAFISRMGAPMLGSDRAIAVPNLSPTPRSWTTLSRFLVPLPPQVEGAPPRSLPSDLVVVVAMGLVGSDATRAWLSMRAVPDPFVSVDELLQDFGAAYARLRVFLSYPIYDAETGLAQTDDSGNVLYARRTDLIRVTFERLSDSLLALSEAPGPIQEKDYPLVVTAMRLAQLGMEPEDIGGLSMKDISIQFLRLWTKPSKAGGKTPVPTTFLVGAKNPAIAPHFAALGFDPVKFLASMKEFMAMSGHGNKPN